MHEKQDTQMVDIIQLALDFQKSPPRYGNLTDPDQALPENIEYLLGTATGEQGEASDSLHKATEFFVEQVFFAPKGNHYRVLGLTPNVSQDQIRKHYKLLLKLFYLDQEEKSAQWNPANAIRINHAYSILRDPRKRAVYDQRLVAQGLHIEGRDEHDMQAEDSSVNSSPEIQEPATTSPNTQSVEPQIYNTAANVSYIAGSIDKAYSIEQESGQPSTASTSAEVIPKLEVPRYNNPEEYSEFQQKVAQSHFEMLLDVNEPKQALKLFWTKNRSIVLGVFLVLAAAVYTLSIQPEQATPNTASSAVKSLEFASNQVSKELQPFLADPIVNSLSEQALVKKAPLKSETTNKEQAVVVAPIQFVEPSKNKAKQPVIKQVTQKARPKQVLAVQLKAQAKPLAMSKSKPITTAKAQVDTKPIAKVIPPPRHSRANGSPEQIETKSINKAKPVVKEPPKAQPPVIVPPVLSTASPTIADDKIEIASATTTTSSQRSAGKISSKELSNLISDFVRSYEAGNLGLFLGLFSTNATTTDQLNLDGIRKDYQELFEATEKRQFIVDGLEWDQGFNFAKGKGQFQVIILAKGDTELSVFNGNITFYVEKGSQGLLINRLVHGYDEDSTQ